MEQSDYAQLMKRAAETNARRDKMEREAGFAAPPDSDQQGYLRTVQSALECGILMEDWNAVAEGAAMLADITKWRPWAKET
jgi:hypothetical protein